MNIWMNEQWIRLDILLLFNLVTGCVSYLLWRLSARLLSGRRSVRYLYQGLKMVLLCFCVPVAYILMYIHFRDRDGSWNGLFMQGTGLILRGAFGIGVIWLLGVFVSVIRNGRELYREYPAGSVPIPADQKEAQILGQVGRTMGIGKRLPVCRGEQMTPAIGGFFCTRLYLGMKLYEEEELRMIFRHELYHYTHGDIWIRRLLLLLRTVYWFCPLFASGRISEDYRRISEDYVDESVCREEDMGRYIRILLETALQSAEKMHLTQATAAESRCDVIRRIENMKNVHRKRKMTRSMAAAWTFGCLLMGSTTVYAAGAGVMKGYDVLYTATVMEHEEQAEDIQYIEYREEPDDSLVMEEGEVLEIGRSSTVVIDWSVGAGVTKATPSFEMASGGEITVSVSVEPTDLEVRVGIVEPDGGRRYITGSNRITHTFSLNQSGNYKVFVKNPNSKKVNINGSYIK
ncbi:MAG: M56 family metallopeptidase [Lachnospiraceae bacterium]|nr:M56 family metallopeptidase [Lachnospiraceae bacterium]